MKTVVACVVGLLAVTAAVAHAASEIDMETTPLIERAKSADATVRREAVVELVGLREVVQQRLKDVVSDANRGVIPESAKATSIYLMGTLRLPGCGAIVDAEKDWNSAPNLWIGESKRMKLLTGTGKLGFLYGNLAVPARKSVDCPESVRLVEGSFSVDLEKYPVISSALTALKSQDPEERFEGMKTIYTWHRIVTHGMSNVFDSMFDDVYSDEVRMTAAYVLGEFRGTSDHLLLRHIDLKDEKGLLAGYPRTLEVDIPDTDYPCAVAVVKISGWEGPLNCINACTNGIIGKEMQQESRDRIARVMMAISPERARQEYRKQLDSFGSSGKGSDRSEDHLRRLKSVESIIMQ